MSHTLIICEKPTAAKSVAEALADNEPKRIGEKAFYYEFEKDGRKFVAVPAVGHLFTLKQSDKGWYYPIFNVEWVPSFNANKFAAFSEPYYRNIEELAKDSKEVIIATDYDEEGEVIGYNILKIMLGRKDALRMKFSTMTKEELLDSYEHMGKINKNLVESGLARHYMDFYWGISLTRALTLAIKSAAKRFRILSTGRVQGPVLHMLSKHEKKIKAFKPEPFWEIEADVVVGKQKMTATCQKGRMWKKDEAEKTFKKIRGKDATVKNIVKKVMTQAPPKPYNTTSFLADIYRYFGYSPQQGLNIAESLYQAGMISYPRTSSEKLPKDINYPKILKAISKQSPYKKDAEFLLNKKDLKPEEGKKIDPAHPAIYPTGLHKKIGGKQQKVYDLAVRRFFAVFGDPAKRESQKLVLDINGEAFELSGKKTLEAGWTSLYGKYAQREEILLPDIKIGSSLKVKKSDMLEKETQPPARFSQGSVLREMEAKGLGTKCLTGDCKIITPDLGDVSLEELWSSSKFFGYDDNIEIRKLNTPTVISLSEIEPSIEFKKPKLISRRKLLPKEKLLSIKTKGGELKATETHLVYLYKNSGIILNEARNISKDDKLLSVISRNKLGEALADKEWFNKRKFKLHNGMYVSRFSANNSLGIDPSKLPIRWSSDLAWILGYFYGDGSYNPPKYNGSHQLYFTTTEKKALDLLKARIKRVFGIEPKAYLVKNNQYKVQCNSAIATLMADIFPSVASKRKFEIPEDFIGDFLRGFFDADGNVHLRDKGEVKIKGIKAVGHGVPRVKITLANRELIFWVNELLNKLGISTEVHEGRAKLKDKYFRCFTIRIGGREKVDRFAWKIGFDVDHKKSTMYKGLLADSLQYKVLKTCYDVVIVLYKKGRDAVEMKNMFGCSTYDTSIAIKRLVKMKIIKRKRLSPYSKPPNRVIYELADKDYYLHALKSSYEHVGGEFYAAKVQDIQDITKSDEFVYDISVTPDSPNFVTNGSLLVHNSTRAQILQILYNRGYLLGKSIEVTELGSQLSDILEKYTPDVISEKLTRHMEEMTDQIQTGKAKKEAVLEDVKKHIERICADFRKKETKIGDELTKAVIATQDRQSILGKCPNCNAKLGGIMKVQKNWRTGKRFVGCTGYKKGCRTGFPLPREGLIMSTEKVCEECKTPIIQVQPPGKRPFRMCLDPNCPTKKDWLDKNKLKKVQKESREGSKLAEQLKCSSCGKSFKSKRALTLHTKIHKEKLESITKA